jgi:glycosyltransferase involved in cell wall biosynthesis
LDAFERFASCDLPRILDSPNGHIRNFREVIDREARDLLGRSDLGHPTRRMIGRIEREYGLATNVRVASKWAKRSLVAGGVPEDKIHVSDLEVDLDRFSPGSERVDSKILRVCYAGSVDLRKGVVYLLRALRRLGTDASLTIVGATGSRPMRQLVERESRGLDLHMRPGDPVPAYRTADLFVLPTLEDGFGYVAAEAMACGLPVVVTDACGAAEWVVEGKTGWIVPVRSTDAIAEVLNTARSRKSELPAMGAEAREAVVSRMRMRPVEAYTAWLRLQYSALGRRASAS